MSSFGVYPVADVLTAGDEISSTYEGRHITLLESDLIHKAGNVGNFVNKGDAVVFGTVALQGVGVSFITATATGDLVAIDTEGIWILPVLPSDDGGQVDVDGGDRLYISITTAIISKIASAATNVPFGYALGHIDAGATAETIAVKVHWDPIDNAVLDQELFFFGDDRDVSIEWDETNLEILPLTDDTGSILFGNIDHHFNSVQIFGITDASYIQYITATGQFNVFNTTVGANAQAEQHEFTQATPTMDDGMGVIENQLLVSGAAVGPFTTLESNWINIGGAGEGHGYMGIRNDGIYSGGDISDAYVFMQKYSYQPDSNANWVSIWELNWAGTNPEIDAIFNVNNEVTSMGYVSGDHDDDTNVGSIPLYSVAHGTIRWVRVYAAAA